MICPKEIIKIYLTIGLCVSVGILLKMKSNKTLILSLQALIIPINDLQTRPLVSESEIFERFLDKNTDVCSSI